MTDPVDLPPGVWLAYNVDGSGVVPFATEVEALRYAIGLMMHVVFVSYGDADWPTQATQ